MPDRDRVYEKMSDHDRRSTIEGRLLDALTPYGGQRIVAGKKMQQLITVLADEYQKMREDGL